MGLDLRYATANNICGRNLYGNASEAWLHREAFVRLEQAVAALARRMPLWSLRIYDAARPLRVQRELFAKVVGTPQQDYVADPAQHSVHNYGFAVDVGLQDEQHQELDLGTPFDAFDELAQPRAEAQCLRDGRLSQRQMDQRLILRQCLLAAGYRENPLEWWHFDARPLEELRGRYPLIA